jgi:hypothetical protein
MRVPELVSDRCGFAPCALQNESSTPICPECRLIVGVDHQLSAMDPRARKGFLEDEIDQFRRE